MKTLRSVLVVEDHPSNLLVATAALDLLNYSYVVAMSGHEAIEQFKLFRFEVILMDIQMPVLDGVKTAKYIRDLEKKEGWAPTPILAMTANYASGDLDQWELAGIENIIPKPFKVNYLAKILAKYCKNNEPIASA